MTTPWQDPTNYTKGKLVKCLECKTECHETHWGKWCFKCNVERLTRINRAFASFAKAIGEPL